MADAAWVLTLAAAIVAGTPLVYAAVGGVLAERSGILNLGMEGMLLLGACCAFLAADATGSVVVGLLAGMVGAGALAAIHAALAITMRANQIVSGLALVIFGTGLATFLGQPIEGKPLEAQLGSANVPGLEAIPVLGRIFFQQDLMIYASWLLAVVATLYLMRTRAGLALRSVGESPATADAMGIRVAAVRYTHTILGGVFAGAGGAYIVLRIVPSWSQSATTSGLGWIALALIVFAGWRPLRVLAGAYLFGVALRGNFALQAAGVRDIPAEFLAMLPYLVTIAVLVLLSVQSLRQRIGAPAALGIPYLREER